MKKFLLAIACTALIGQTMVAQQEVQYVEDETQGYVLNRFQDNWFITAEGGTNIMFGPGDVHRNLEDRFGYNASLWVGKWFSPIIGMRIGGEWIHAKSLTVYPNAMGVQKDAGMVDGKYYRQRISYVGPQIHVMLNLTNWWCGYSPSRVYDLIIYGGAGGTWAFTQTYDAKGNKDGYKDAHDKTIDLEFGIMNMFRLNKHIDLGLDIRCMGKDDNTDQIQRGWHRTAWDLQANLALTYRFNRTDWSHPMVPVCAPTEDCEPLRRALDVANARIADLESQLEACLNRPAEVVETVVEAEQGPLATIYFPINVSKLTKEDVAVVNAVAEVIKMNPSTNYVVTGWADNYTGNDQINVRLRNERAASVANQLYKAGVAEQQITTTINNGSLCDLGEKFMALDRAATITIAE